MNADNEQHEQPDEDATTMADGESGEQSDGQSDEQSDEESGESGDRGFDWIKFGRIAFALAGLAALVVGVVAAVGLGWRTLVMVGAWLVGAIVLHDAVLSPLTLTVGVLLRRAVPDRARRFLQFGLIVAALVTVIAVPMIALEGSQPPQKALLNGDYAAHLAVLLGLIAVAAVVGYAVQVVRDRRRGLRGEGRGGGPGSGSGPADPAADQPA